MISFPPLDFRTKTVLKFLPHWSDIICTFHSGVVLAELHSGVLMWTKLLEFRNRKG